MPKNISASEMGKLSAQKRFEGMTKEERSEYMRVNVWSKHKENWVNRMTPEEKSAYFKRIWKLRKRKKTK